jgi:hypothetical protein
MRSNVSKGVGFSKKTILRGWVGVGSGEGKKVGKMSICPTFRYRFDLLMVSADTMVDFKVRFLYRAILSSFLWL